MRFHIECYSFAALAPRPIIRESMRDIFIQKRVLTLLHEHMYCVGGDGLPQRQAEKHLWND
jgi:hypothetical protein